MDIQFGLISVLTTAESLLTGHLIFSRQARDLLVATSSQWPVNSRFPSQKKDKMAGSGENHSIETSASSKTKKNNERLWTDEEPEQLITTYDGRKCLWDFTSKQCSERDQKPLAFNSIDEKMSQVKSFEEPIHERSCITTITTLTSTSPCCDRQVCKKKCYRLDPSPLAKVRAKVKVRTHPRCFQKFLYIF